MISTLDTRTLPLRAILQHDLWGLTKSWLVRIWFAATVLLTALVILTNWPRVPSAPLIAMVLFPYLIFPWFLVVMMLGVNPTSGSRADAMADGFLCRPVTRYECLLGTWLARVLLVWGVYLAVTVPAVAIIALANRPIQDDGVTLYGVIAALSVVAIVLALQVSLAFLMGTVLRRSLVAVVVLLFAWYPINAVLHTFSLEEFSPISLNQSLPTLLRQPWREDIEKPADKAEDMEALARQAAQFFNMLSGDAGAADGKAGFLRAVELRGLFPVACPAGLWHPDAPEHRPGHRLFQRARFLNAALRRFTGGVALLGVESTHHQERPGNNSKQCCRSGWRNAQHCLGPLLGMVASRFGWRLDSSDWHKQPFVSTCDF